MRLYLVQHGEAVAKEIDLERPLTEQGRLDVQRLATFLAASGAYARRVFHSGKLRAAQTAELLAAELAPEANIEPMPGLNPLDPVAPFAQQLADWTQDTLVVGHLPFMAALVAHLIADLEGAELVAFTPGTAVCLERTQANAWGITWMIRPELLRV